MSAKYPNKKIRSPHRKCKSQNRMSVELNLSSIITSDSVVSPNGNEFVKQSTKITETVNMEKEIPLFRLESNFIKSDIGRSLINGESNLINANLDHVQWEIESMLTYFTKRRNTINNQLRTFESMQFYSSQQNTDQTRSPKTLYRPIAAVSNMLPLVDNLKNDFDFFNISEDVSPPEQKKSANEFWSFVKPYLAHGKKEDIDWLEQLVRSYDSNNNLNEIPPLGKHYANHWIQEKLEIEKEQSCSQPETRTELSEQLAADMTELMNKVTYSGHNGNLFEPIYKRVTGHLKTLCDQNYSKEHGNQKGKSPKKNKVCKESYMEQNFKKQVYKLGMFGHHAKPVLPPSKANSDEDRDEILEEINKCNSMLAKLQETNKIQLTYLLEKCRDDYHQQIKIKDREQLDKKILNFGRQQSDLFQKGNKYTQHIEEKQYLRLLLNERSSYLKQPRAFGSNISTTSVDLNNLNMTSVMPEVVITDDDDSVKQENIIISDADCTEQDYIIISDEECMEKNVIIIESDDD